MPFTRRQRRILSRDGGLDPPQEDHEKQQSSRGLLVEEHTQRIAPKNLRVPRSRADVRKHQKMQATVWQHLVRKPNGLPVGNSHPPK